MPSRTTCLQCNNGKDLTCHVCLALLPLIDIRAGKGQRGRIRSVHDGARVRMEKGYGTEHFSDVSPVKSERQPQWQQTLESLGCLFESECSDLRFVSLPEEVLQCRAAIDEVPSQQPPILVIAAIRAGSQVFRSVGGYRRLTCLSAAAF